MLGRLGFSAALVTLVAALVIPLAGASAPIREEVVFTDLTFDDFYLSDACGTTVLDTIDLSVSVTFFPAAHGSPANEVDRLNGSITYSSPDTGNSLTRPMHGPTHTVYPEGIAPGSPALSNDHWGEHSQPHRHSTTRLGTARRQRDDPVRRRPGRADNDVRDERHRLDEGHLRCNHR